jgi:HD-GYP domain-containing protein (c-di-GMP phosphodiesterase class II)
VYIALVLAAAVCALLVATVVDPPPTIQPILVLAPIYLVALALPARLATGVVLTANVPVLIAAYLIGGWQSAALVAATGIVLRRHKALANHAFNTAQFVLIATVGGLAYERMGGQDLVSLDNGGFEPGVLVPVVLSAAAVIVANLLLMLPILKLAEGISGRSVWRSMVLSSAVPYLAYGLFGLLMAVLWNIGGGFAASLILIPLLVARWAFGQYAEQRESYEATIRSLVKAVETKDHYTRGHSERVSRASVMIARVVGMRDDRVDALRYAGILHDIGKLGVPTRILQKDTMLDDTEFAAIQRHPEFATEIVRGISFLKEAHAGILHHHERLDGLGYPLGLKGSDIPEFARIIAVADAFDSMTSTRSYRGARTVEDALVELRACQGTQFDAVMVEALIASLERQPWRSASEAQQEATAGELAGQVREGFDHDDPTALHPRGHDPEVAASALLAEVAEEIALRSQGEGP